MNPNLSPDDVSMRLKAAKLLKEVEQKDADRKAYQRKMLSDVLAQAHSSPQALHTFRMSLAEEMAGDWYRRSLLAKVLSGQDAEALNLSMLTWAKTEFISLEIPTDVVLLEELMITLADSATYTDNFLIKQLDLKQHHMKDLPEEMFVQAVSGAFDAFIPTDEGDTSYAMMNGTAWSVLMRHPSLAERLSPTSKHPLLLMGVLGTVGRRSMIAGAPTCGTIQVISDAFCGADGQSLSQVFKAPTFFFLQGALTLAEPITVAGRVDSPDYIAPVLTIKLSDLEGTNVIRKISLME